jgi:hypothetical protein
MASIDSLDFVKKSYCADYGTVKKDYNSVKTGIDTVLLSKSSTKPDIEESESPKLSNSTFNKLDILKPFLALVLV